MTDKIMINNTPNASKIWSKIGSSFENIAQAICELIDNAISNFRGHRDYTALNRMIRIAVRNLGSTVEVTVEDGGTGIKDLDNAMTLAGTNARESVLNEHGFGMKHALSYMDGNECTWEILTRTAQDRDLNRYVRVQPPYNFGMGAMFGTYASGWEGHLGSTGTVIRFTCPLSVFETLAPDSKAKLSFEQLVDILSEHLRYTYADILARREISMELCWENGKKNGRKMLDALLPQWEDGTLVELPDKCVDLGGGPLTIRCRYGAIRPDETTQCHYSANLETSGAEIRINGRVLESGLMKVIWGRASHPVYNSFLAQIDLISDNAQALPDTKTAKNGFRAEKEKAKKLFQWIHTNVEIPRDNMNKEKRLFLALAELKHNSSDAIRATPEEYVFHSIGLNVRVDLFVSDGEKVSIYEGKVCNTHCLDAYQLRMYWDGCVMDGIHVDEGLLIAKNHSEEVQQLIRHLNTLTGPDGRQYNFRITTWAEEGVCA